MLPVEDVEDRHLPGRRVEEVEVDRPRALDVAGAGPRHTVGHHVAERDREFVHARWNVDQAKRVDPGAGDVQTAHGERVGAGLRERDLLVDVEGVEQLGPVGCVQAPADLVGAAG
ncbi:MAG: hypothetical protein ACRDK3_02060 [Actinomycetota bacterium]